MAQNLALSRLRVGGIAKARAIAARLSRSRIKFADFEIISRSQSFTEAISDRAGLERTSIALLEKSMPPPKAVRLLGVSLSALHTADVESPQFQCCFEASILGGERATRSQ